MTQSAVEVKKPEEPEKIEGSVIIDKPVETVWKFVTDLSNAPKWFWDVLEMRQTSEGPLGAGTKLVNRHAHHPKDSVSAVVSEFEPNRRFTFEITSGPVKGAQVTISMETIEGKTKLSLAFNFKLSGFYKLMYPFVIGRTRRTGKSVAETSVAKVKSILESEPH